MQLLELARIGLAAGPFQRSPSMLSPQRADTSAQALHRTLITQASQALQPKMQPAAYYWATPLLKLGLWNPNTGDYHYVNPGDRIVVDPSQTSAGRVKMWFKYGQTFDSSAWVPTWINPQSFKYTGGTVQWSNATGFGFTPAELTDLQQRIDAAATAAADHAADAAQRRAAEKITATGAATRQTVYIGVAVAGIVGGVIGGYVGYRMARG